MVEKIIGNGNKRLPIHELAVLFPAMSDEEYTALKQDISVNGVRQPIAVWKGKIIDGRHRYQICSELGLEAPLRYLDDHADPAAFILSANINRRQLTSSQKVIITAQLQLSEPELTTTQRAQLAGVRSSWQRYADAVVQYGDLDIIEQVKSGSTSIDVAYKAVNRARKARADAEKAEKAQQEAEAKARTVRDAKARARAERKAAEARTRNAEKSAVAEKESAILKAAKQQYADNPSMTLADTIKDQRRLFALREAMALGDQSPYRNDSGDVDLSNAVRVGQHSRVVFSNNLDPSGGIPSLPDESVALTFTSPPYWNFMEYGKVGAGHEESYTAYIETLREVFECVNRKTVPGGRIVVNISNMKSRKDVESETFVYPIVGDLTRTMIGLGLTFFDEIIWQKSNANAGALNGSPLWGSYPYPPTPKILDSTFENILVFTKAGQRNVNQGMKEQSRLDLKEWREFTKGIWNIPHDRDPNHPATFPVDLADRVIRLYSFVNDIVLDPFAGTGTTVISAEKNQRAGVGFEITHMYQSAVREKAAQWLTLQ